MLLCFYVRLSILHIGIYKIIPVINAIPISVSYSPLISTETTTAKKITTKNVVSIKRKSDNSG